MEILYLLAALVALLYLQVKLIDRFAWRGFRYERGFSKKAGFAGETVEMVEVIRNAKLLPVPWLRAESRMSSHLRFASEASEGVREEAGESAFHRSVFFLAPYAQVTRTHRVELLKRGRYAAGSVSLTAGDLFGLTAKAMQIETGAAVSVYPRLLPDGELDIPSSRYQGDLIVKRWIVPDPFLAAGIREWQPGDSRRDIHWAATARMGMLQVKTRDYTANPKLLVVINVQMNEHQWADLMAYEQDVIEYGISLAATLCLRAVSGGVEAGVAANAPLEAEKAPMLLPPGRYAGRDTDILEALARLRILRVRSFPAFLEDLTRFTGLDIIILSAYDSEMIRERMRQLTLRGNSVALWPIKKGAAS